MTKRESDMMARPSEAVRRLPLRNASRLAPWFLFQGGKLVLAESGPARSSTSLCMVKGDISGYFLMRRVTLSPARFSSAFRPELLLFFHAKAVVRSGRWSSSRDAFEGEG